MPSARNAVALVAVSIATLGVYVGIFVLDTTKDNPATLDNQPTKGVATAACTTLRLDLDALPPLPATATVQQRVSRIGEQDRAVQQLITAVRAVGEPALKKDVPSEQWLGDWATLTGARDAYAAAGASGPFAVPVVDEHLLTERMNDVGLPDCVVPVSLTVAP